MSSSIAAQVAGTLRRDIVAEDLPPLLATIVEASHDDFYAHRNWKRYMELILDGLSTPAPSRLRAPQLARALAQLLAQLDPEPIDAIIACIADFSAMPTPPSQLWTVPVAVRASRRLASNTKWPT